MFFGSGLRQYAAAADDRHLKLLRLLNAPNRPPSFRVASSDLLGAKP
jgi:hypothetical protein